jgi:hypothetical protein
MNLDLEITRAWESANATGGALASALHARRDAAAAISTPDDLRRPSTPRTEKDTMGEVLILLEEAKRANLRASGQIQLAIDDTTKALATR